MQQQTAIPIKFQTQPSQTGQISQTGYESGKSGVYDQQPQQAGVTGVGLIHGISQQPFKSQEESQKQQFQQPQEEYLKKQQYQQQPFKPQEISQQGVGGVSRQMSPTFQQQQPSQVKPQEFGVSQQQQTGFKGMEWSEKQIQANNVGVTDLAVLHCLLRLSGICYVKEHLMMKLAEDNSGLLKEWHHNVTIKNLDNLSEIAHKIGLTLPFPKSLEQREHQIKNSLQNVPKVITEGEALSDLCSTAHLLIQEFTCGFMTGLCPEFKEACRVGCGVVSENYLKLKEVLRNTEQYYPPAIVKSVVCHEGITSRK
jgi:hypothetical protein